MTRSHDPTTTRGLRRRAEQTTDMHQLKFVEVGTYSTQLREPTILTT